jgi:hypothetical protein
MPVRRSLARRGKFDTLEFLAELSVHIPKTYESLTRHYGRYSCRRRGERAKLIPPPEDKTKIDEMREFPKSSSAAHIKRIYEIDPSSAPNAKRRCVSLPSFKTSTP